MPMLRDRRSKSAISPQTHSWIYLYRSGHDFTVAYTSYQIEERPCRYAITFLSRGFSQCRLAMKTSFLTSKTSQSDYSAGFFTRNLRNIHHLNLQVTREQFTI